jgi:hypothetical protein
MSSDRFEDLAKGLATTSTRRGALGVLAGGIAALWGLGRVPTALASGHCVTHEDCKTGCCCFRPRKGGGKLGHPGFCSTPDHCLSVGGTCL